MMSERIKVLEHQLAKAQAENARLAEEVSAWSALVNDIMQEGPPQHPKYVVRAKHLADEANISTLRDLLGPAVEALEAADYTLTDCNGYVRSPSPNKPRWTYLETCELISRELARLRAAM